MWYNVVRHGECHFNLVKVCCRRRVVLRGGGGTPGSGLAVSVSCQGHLPVGMFFRFSIGNEITFATGTQVHPYDYAYSYDDENRLVSVTPTNLTHGRTVKYGRRMTPNGKIEEYFDPPK